MALQSFNYLHPADVQGLDLTPERTNYLDVYDFSTYNIPDLRRQIIEKYNPTITGFVEKFANKEQMTSDKFVWSEREHPAITYADGVVNIGATTLSLASGNQVLYRLHEKIRVHTGVGAGTFIITAINAAHTEVTIGTYDSDSIALQTAAVAEQTGVYVYSLGIEVGKGSLGEDFTEGLKLPYSILSNRPTITRDHYNEVGSITPQLKWVEINGQYKWFLAEIDETRRRFFEAIEKKLVEGVYPDAASDAATTLGLQGTQGMFDALFERAGVWEDIVSTTDDLEAIIKHRNKVQAAGTNLWLCNQDQEFAFDALGRTFNSSYGASGPLKNNIGDYDNSESGKVLKLGFKGFEYGGYTELKQGWKYLKENTFRGNEAISVAERINFVSVPVGMTPVTEGDANLATNPVIHQRNYMTNLFLRDYVYHVDGSFTGNGLANNADDRLRVDFLNESMLALFNAEKFVLGIGSQA